MSERATGITMLCCSALIITQLCAIAAAQRIVSADEWHASLRALVASELSFAQAAGEKGIRDAFLAYLADDSVLFRPHPVAGKKWLLDRPAAPGVLSWYPVAADLSASGDLSYTTGPYELRKQAGDKNPASTGNYFSIWKKQANDDWKVLIDFGCASPSARNPLLAIDVSQARPPVLPRGTTPVGIPSRLMQLDREWSGENAVLAEIQAHIGETARFLRANKQPAVGAAHVRALLDAGGWRNVLAPLQSGVAISGDLGYTYGSLKSGKSIGGEPETGYYLRVWKLQPTGLWKIAIEVAVL